MADTTPPAAPAPAPAIATWQQVLDICAASTMDHQLTHVWHPQAVVGYIDNETAGNILAGVGDPAYQLSTGEVFAITP